jgi:restriction system protein
MSIPTYDQLIAPLLKVLADNPAGLKVPAAYEAVANAVGLSEDDRRELLPSGKQPVYMNRIGWANDRLKRAGLSKPPSEVSASRTWQLTEEGLEFAKDHGDSLDPAVVEQLAKVGPGSKVRKPPADPTRTTVPLSVTETQSPDERIDAAAAELDESLSADLLGAMAGMHPVRFEQLVLDLLHAMGYGASRADLHETPGSGDGGIDGIITLDRLGLERVYTQAKRWNTGTVGRPEIQKFVGALAGHGGNRGVFITTSTFSNEARQYTDQVPQSLVLIDGNQLAGLMIDHDVGVTTQRTVKICRIDADYFEEM